MAKKIVKAAPPVKAKKTVPVAKAGAPKKSLTAKKEADLEAIRKKAEEIYHARVARGEHGTAEDDWHKAEKFLKAGGKTVAKKSAKK